MLCQKDEVYCDNCSDCKRVAKLSHPDLILLFPAPKEPKIDEVPFNAVNKYSASLHKYSKEKNIYYLMGAPEFVIEKSSFIECNKKQLKLNNKIIKNLKDSQKRLTSKGLRVIAVAYKTTNNKKIEKSLNSEMIFSGLLALKDPLRKTAKNAIRICQDAGIRPIIITGDHMLTARAIAEEIGIKNEKENILTGNELNKLSNKELSKKIKNINIFARIEPIQKLKIVKIYKNKEK